MRCIFLFVGIATFAFGDLAQDLQKIRSELQQTQKIDNPKEIQLLNASYDPTRELYEEIDQKFAKWWKDKTGQSVEVMQSHGGSSAQVRAVSQGLPADVVTLALSYDIDVIAEDTHSLPKDWASRLPNLSVPFNSTIVFLVRKGNPKKIKDWDDLIKDGVSIITPNPKTSGGARWIYLAAWGYAQKNDPIAFMKKLYENVPILDTGARSATTTFIQEDIGDVLITWESEAHLAIQELGDGKFEIVMPSVTIRTDPPVAWLDTITTKKGTTEAARMYLSYLYSKEAQEIAVKHFLRPIDPSITNPFPKVFMLTIDDFGGWEKVEKIHFKDGALFDQIYSR